jgi:hypothetical protein
VPVGEHAWVVGSDPGPACLGLLVLSQPFVFLADPAHQVGVDAPCSSGGYSEYWLYLRHHRSPQYTKPRILLLAPPAGVKMSLFWWPRGQVVRTLTPARGI